MKFKLIPVILTAALTSVLTLFIAAHYQTQIPYFTASSAPHGGMARFTDGNLSPSGGPVNFEAAAENSVKAVVHIKTTTKARTIVAQPNSDDFFGQLFGQRQYYIPPQMGSGSGVAISADGYIVTNNHVVADATEVTVTYNNRFTTTAKVIGTDPATDIAVLKVDEKDLPYMEFGNSDDVRLGQWVLAVGYPLTLDATVTAGIVSAKGRSIGINATKSANAIESFIQTDAAVNPGNSGGALVNTAGQLIGINSAIASPTGSYAGYSYAIPSNIVRKAVNDLMKYGTVQRGYLGIGYLDNKSASPEQLTALGFDKNDGVYVTNVGSNSGAAKAGLAKGDFITQINNEAIHSESDLMEKIARYHPGDNIGVTYSRGGKVYNTTVQLKNLNGNTDIVKEATIAKLLGASFRPLTANEINSYAVNGVMITDVGAGILAKQTNVKKGFVITGVNDDAVSSVDELQQALAGNDKVQIAGFYPGGRGMYYFGLNNLSSVTANEQ